MIAQKILLSFLSLGILALGAVSGLPAGAGAASPPGEITMRVPLSAEAEGKVDPRIRLALAIPERSVSSLAAVGRTIALAGESLEELRFPVLIRTRLSDRELAALGASPHVRAGDIVTAEVRAADMDRLASDPGVEAIEASYILHPSLDVSIPEIRANLINQGSPPTGYTGSGVILGLLDSGIDITHDDFKGTDNHTRVLYIWDQGREDGTHHPAGYGYGYEYTKAMIDAGQASQFTDDGGHGSHVAGIAAGDGSSTADHKYRGVAWQSDIIVVRNGYRCDMFCYGGGIPPMGPTTSEGSIDGLNYLLQKAQALGKPMVVNQSQGVTMGPHDGTTLYETAYQNLITQNGLIICIAAGNDQESDWHGRTTVSPGGQGNFTITNSPADPVSAFAGWMMFECWYKSGDTFSWELHTPGNTNTILIPASTPTGQYPGTTTANADTVFYYSITSHPSNQQGYVNVYFQNRRLGVQTGDWTFKAIATNGLPAGGVVDLYCERNQYTVKVTQNLSLDGIVGMPGSTSGAITVASYNTKIEWDAVNGHHTLADFGINETLADLSTFSSHGPRRDGFQKPDIGAPGQMVASVLAAGTTWSNNIKDPDGKHLLIQGTSMACPHVAGTVALMLQKDPTLNPADVKSLLQQTARTDQYTGSAPNAGWGYGKLDAKAAVDAVGGGEACATQAGDANGDASVNVLDVVATVNDILLTVPLGTGGRACADMDGSSVINVLDVVAIVNRILHPAVPGELLAWEGAGKSQSSGSLNEAEAVPWSQEFTGSSFRITLDGTRVAGLQLSCVLPRGFEVAGPPVLLGSASGVAVAAGGSLGLHTIVAYNGSGGSLGEGNVTLQVPVKQEWDAGQSLRELDVVEIVLSDTSGRPLRLSAEPAEDEAEGAVGLRGWLGGSVPNPASGSTQISYGLGLSSDVSLTVHDVAGRQVRSLWSGWQMAGGHTLAWDGRDDQGTAVPAGVYFVHLRGAGAGESRKILVVR